MEKFFAIINLLVDYLIGYLKPILGLGEDAAE